MGSNKDLNPATPFPVTSGEEYEYQIRPVTNANVFLALGVSSFDNPYPGGQLTIGGAFDGSFFDLIDLTSIKEINTSTPIPTLSQWGIIALSMIMLIFGVVALKDSIALRLQGKQLGRGK